MLSTSAWPDSARGRPGPALRDLAPIQLYAVPEVSVDPPRPLADPADAESMSDAVTPDATGLPGALAIPDIPYDYFWTETDFQKWHRTKVSRTSPGLLGSTGWRRTPRMRARWLSTPARDSWTLGTSNWRYTGEHGLGVSLGNNEIEVPAWGNTARMGGISVSQSSQVGSDSQRWQYAMSVGALDYSSQPQGDLDYGPTASNTVLRYQINPQITLESQLEAAPDLIATGVGGRYATDNWGAWSAGVAKASYGMHGGWRYQTAYEVDVLDTVQLSWLRERHTMGFADLSRYADGVSVGGIRQQVSASVPMGRWGDVAGTYESARSSLGDTQRSFGLTQQFWYSPNLRIGLKAERQLVSGDYDVGIRFSVPIN
ncbi:hypothetical protein CR155_14890 [Pollutimonas nitritireducens]|uniref:Uncharacterized protein n=1 Tax=Pollutimonas nitritireducens TaxID=2045209 RepID=A0A2N4UDJ3_9BURK|nr:hypothetical protein [Pollutimonas nitritireducens]PLC53083.1 hypothetical protein CR155_14890 [Pollutimonas nitritireducens]